MMMPAAWIGNGTLWIGTEGTATHGRARHHRGLQGLERKPRCRLSAGQLECAAVECNGIGLRAAGELNSPPCW